MSLIKQLWIAIIVVMLFAFGGSLIVSTLSARHYLEQQLHIKNIDNATSLALSLSQMPKDPVTVELQIASQFDAGHYRLIRLNDPTGAVIIEREYHGGDTGAPLWFAHLFPIAVNPGIAQVQDGWHQYGTLSVESHSDYAYAALWKGTLLLLLWFLSGGLITGIVGTVILKHLMKPLDQVVKQAEALSERRFITIPQPRTLEFRKVVKAMNALSERMRQVFVHESQRLEELRLQSQYDTLTGLLNTDQFFKLLDAALSREDAHSSGTLLVVRIENLKQLNHHLGAPTVNSLLKDIGEIFKTFAAKNDLWDGGRLGGADLALLAVGEEDADRLGREFHEALQPAVQRWREHNDQPLILSTGGTNYQIHENYRRILMRVDEALTLAQQERDMPFVIVSDEALQTLHDRKEWRVLISNALQSPGIKLQHYPVLSSQGTLIHMEAPARLMFNGQWHNAGYFMRWATRTGLISDLDFAAISAALEYIGEEGTPTAIHVSPQSLCDQGFRNRLFACLQRQPELAAKLWLEVPETGVLKCPTEFRSLCLTLKPLGCKIGIEHVGRQFSRIGNLHELGLDYIKVDAALIRDIDSDAGNQSFVRGLCVVAHAIGLRVIAEGVNTTKEQDSLAALGLDGMTGPAITLRQT